MDRKTTTQFLNKVLERDRLSGIGKYWAKEVSIDPWAAKGKPKRIDYMQFVPENQCSIAAIEKGIFICYEVKSCVQDVYSGNVGEDMDLGRARRIIRNIYDEETEVADKITAIQEELDAERHAAVSKEHLIEVLRWLMEEYI